MRPSARPIYVAIGAVVVLAAIGFVWWHVDQRHAKNLSGQTFTTAPDKPSTGARPSGGVTAARDGTGGTVTTPGADTSAWKTYANSRYGFQFKYPPGWGLSTSGLANDSPFVAVGIPMGGIKSYAMDVFISPNPHHDNAKQFVAAMLKETQAADEAADKNGEAPDHAPQYDSEKSVVVGGYEGYELYGVFEGDQSAESIYVPGNRVVLQFDFPTPEPNGNLSFPAKNNRVAHQILQTLVFTPPKR